MSLGLPKEKQFELPPADSHAAICYRIIDFGTQKVEWEGTTKFQHKILLSWELDALMADGENAGKPFSIHKRYTYSMSPKGSLRPDLEAWRGRPFTDEEMDNFKLHRLLGIPCLLGIVHTKKDGKVYANISSIMKLPKSMAVPKPVNPTVDFDLGEFDQKLYESFSDNLKETIAQSPEYAQATGKGINTPESIQDASTRMDEEIAF